MVLLVLLVAVEGVFWGQLLYRESAGFQLLLAPPPRQQQQQAVSCSVRSATWGQG
jgi:hypothetical protein